MLDEHWARIAPGGDRHPPVSAASTSRVFANSFRFFANVGSMQFTQRQRLFRGRWGPLLAAIPVGLLLGFLGPFGSYPAYPTATRYAFWLGLTAAGVVAAVAADAMLPVSRLRAGAIRIGAVALVSALPMTFVVAWTMALVQPGRFFTPQQLPALFAAVAAVQLLVVYATTTISPTVDDAEAPGHAPALPEPGAEAIPAAFPSALLSRLPPGIGSDIIALETEDHYLRVHAPGGSALILMRMADAVALLDPRLGAQVHRRWWVAEAAVAGVRTEGQKLSLCLTDQTLVPVGRTFSAAAKARFAHVRNIGPPGLAGSEPGGGRSAFNQA
jgi:DNA-binding LytR/AlgR family response regulator